MLDVDECTDGTHDCMADHATCNNFEGFFNCTCSVGFRNILHHSQKFEVC